MFLGNGASIFIIYPRLEMIFCLLLKMPSTNRACEKYYTVREC